MKYSILSVAVLALGLSNIAFAQDASSGANQNYSIFMPNKLTWSTAPNSLPAGAKIDVLAGDPSSSGPFTIRLKFPANYKVAPHTHPGIEQVTVISGDFHIGFGDTFNKKDTTSMSAGSFLTMQPGVHHFAYTNSGAVIQLNGVGPWGIDYLNSKDDPRNKTA